ncbi:MAG TPA: GNAT family N-acetyltransferase, partial [Azospira sp.]|nr:GNAT family N-acetyltransferase [Azospira sp.]
RVNGIPLRLWELPTHPHLALGDPLLAPDWDPALLVRLLVQALERRADRPWDALRLPNLPDDSLAVRGRLDAALSWAHRERAGGSMYFDCSHLDVALARCGSGFARNLRRQARKLEQQGTVTMTLARHGDELDAAFADFLRLEASGWKGAAGKLSAIALHPRLLDFYQTLKNRFAANEACLISLLKLDDKVIAAQFCLRAGDTLYLQKIAYDEAWRAEAPGNQLLHRLLEHCCADPEIRRLSLVTGPAWAVGRWNPECQPVWEILVFRRSLRGVCGLALRHLKARLWAPARARWRRYRAGRGGPAANDGAPAAPRPEAVG